MTNTIKNIAAALCLAGSVALCVGVSGCSGSRYHRSTGAYLDDKTISTKVKTELYADPEVKGTQVSVRTYEGKVQLSGYVDTNGQKDRAAEIARRVRGVQWVKNDLVVKSAMPTTPTVGATAGTTNRIQEPAGTGTQNVQPAPSDTGTTQP